MANSAAALHILVKHKEQAEDIIKQLKKGAKFQTLAKKYSTCPSGKKGGDWVSFVADRWLRNLTKFASRERHSSLT